MEIIDKLVRWKGKFMSAVEIHYRDAKGVVWNWEAVERVNVGGIVVMVAITPANTVLLEKQFRPPLGRDVIEVPAGLVDLGESMEDAARRELIEETGWSARELGFLAEGPISTGASTEILRTYLCTGLELVGKSGGDDNEIIEVIEVPENRENIIQFLRDIVAIPSKDGQLRAVGECIQNKMRELGFDEARFDKMGNTVGRIGNGPKVIVFDSHIDTVGVGDPAEWEWDPFVGKVEDGRLYARGACDEKGSTPGMVYGLAIARDLGLLDGYTAYYSGNMEEWCDGIAPNSFVDADPQVRPDFVVIDEPTKMQIYRGHKGRIELKITAHGRSAHAASHYLGDNAVYKMMSIITQIRELDRRFRCGMGYHPIQGFPSIAVTDVGARTASPVIRKSSLLLTAG